MNEWGRREIFERERGREVRKEEEKKRSMPRKGTLTLREQNNFG